MVVQNIECQISAVLMKRFLDGETLPPEVLADLEQHLRVCPECQAIVNGEGPSLDEILDGPAPKSGLASLFAGSPAPPTGATAAMFQAATRTHSTAPGLAVFKSPKVLVLSGALAIVLITMSTVLRNPQNLLGPRAASLYTESGAAPEEHPQTDELPSERQTHAETKPEEQPTHSEPTDTHAETSAPSTDTPEPATTPTNLVTHEDPRVPGKPTLDQTDLIVAKAGSINTEQSDSSPSSQKHTTSSKPKQTPAPKRNTNPSPKPARKPAASSSGTGITVYGPDGKPIK